jgi:ABC-type phosphate/phosphonate transport system substrate-binding protein
MSRIASLTMYDLPELRAETDAWWSALARAFRREGIDAVPDGLDRATDRHAAWLSTGLLIAQTCGYPLTHALAGRVRLVASPRYGAPGCEGFNYSSAIVVRRDDPATTIAGLAGRRVAFNGIDSQSGYNTLRAAVAPHAKGGRFFATAVRSGAHRESLRMVATGEADCAALDGVTFALIERVAPAEVASVRVLDWTPSAPSLPYITAMDTSEDDIARLRAGLTGACADPDATAARQALLIDGFDVRPLDDYAVIDAMERDAGAAGYPELA